MNLTLSLIFGMLWLAPGILALILWNQRGRRQGVRQPEQHLTALNGIALALGVSLAVHLVGALLADLVTEALRELGHGTLVSPYRTMAILLTRPISGTGARAIEPEQMSGVLEFGGVLVWLSALVWMLGRSPGLSLMLSGRDSHGLGWAFQHIVAPAEHGYVQVAHVLTTTIENGKGLGYAGGIVDIRLSDTGQVKAITLSPTERFVYALGSQADRPAPDERVDTVSAAAAPLPALAGFAIEESKVYGAAVHLGEGAIANILVINYDEAELAAFAQEQEAQAGARERGDDGVVAEPEFAAGEDWLQMIARRTAGWLLP